ncbi:MAG: DUF6174 domain-containing protein [Treponema sp.]|nr:DUF6174 domain-containing protein [Treponema sp.]
MKLAKIIATPFLGISLLAALSSCGMVPVKVEFDQKTFNEQRALWQDTKPQDYEYKLIASGFMGYSGTISVVNGKFEKDEPNMEWHSIYYFSDYTTIDKIYQEIEETFLRYNDTRQFRGDVYYTGIVVEYDKTNHIPTKIVYKYYCPPNVSVDGTFHYEIENFVKTE